MRNKGTSRPLKLAHIAPAFFLLSLLAGCAALPKDRQGMVSSGYMTKAVLKGGYLHYSIGSLLAGAPTNISCAPEQGQDNAVAIVDCAGAAAGERETMAAEFGAASTSYLGLSKGLGISRTRLVLVPDGARFRESARFVARPSQLSMALAVRYAPGDQQLRRNAVRVYVHELVHLNRVASGWNITKAREEYLASLMESCVELEVFGETRGYALDGEVAAAGIEGLSRSQRRSADMFLAAYMDVRAFTSTGMLRRGQGSFEGFCRMSFNAVE